MGKLTIIMAMFNVYVSHQRQFSPSPIESHDTDTTNTTPMPRHEWGQGADAWSSVRFETQDQLLDDHHMNHVIFPLLFPIR